MICFTKYFVIIYIAYYCYTSVNEYFYFNLQYSNYLCV